MIRIDLYLFEKGYVKSRKKAQDLIKSGCVNLDKCVVTKTSLLIDPDIDHEIIIHDNCPYVSRGGLKLEKVLIDNKFELKGKSALDIGASTGGFTDCLLQHGINDVVAIDSGTNQLDSRLLLDKRVKSIENYNAKNIKYEDFNQRFDYITIDVSFISQTLLTGVLNEVASKNCKIISLIKPQFETTKSKLSKGGILKDSKERYNSIIRVIDSYNSNNLYIEYFDVSPIKGGDGNTEYLAVFSNNSVDNFISNTLIKKIVEEGK